MSPRSDGGECRVVGGKVNRRAVLKGGREIGRRPRMAGGDDQPLSRSSFVELIAPWCYFAEFRR
jgi:hypothetical protein